MGFKEVPNDVALDTLDNVRKKGPRNPKWIKTIWGFGVSIFIKSLTAGW